MQTLKEKIKDIEKNARKTVSVCLVSCALVIVTQIFFAIIALSLLEVFPLPFFSTFLGMLIVDIIVYALGILIPISIALILSKRYTPNIDFQTPRRYFTKKPILYILGSIGLAYGLNLIISICFPEFVEQFSSSVEITANTPIEILLTCFLYALLPAILEESLFRGVFLKKLLPYGRFCALFVSSLLFGLVHIDPPRIIFATVFGMLLGYCYEYTGSLVMPMITHFINNAISVAASLLYDNLGAVTTMSTFMIALVLVGIGGLIYFCIHGIAKHEISINNPMCIGYKLNPIKSISILIFNFAAIPFLFVFVFYYFLYY